MNAGPRLGRRPPRRARERRRGARAIRPVSSSTMPGRSGMHADRDEARDQLAPARVRREQLVEHRPAAGVAEHREQRGQPEPDLVARRARARARARAPATSPSSVAALRARSKAASRIWYAAVHAERAGAARRAAVRGLPPGAGAPTPPAPAPSGAVDDTRSAADCCPRMSPPSASAASSAARRRSSRSPDAAVNASAIASGTVGLRIMFACTDQPGPVRWPAYSMHASPVCAAARPALSTIATWRVARPASAATSAVERGAGRFAVAHPLEPERPVAELRRTPASRPRRRRPRPTAPPRRPRSSATARRRRTRPTRDRGPRSSRSPAHPPAPPPDGAQRRPLPMTLG